jgi:non-specific serine/threonine protein kinase
MAGAPDAGSTTRPGPDNSSWSLALRALREAAGVTREGWAAALGYGRTTVQRWETGETVPDAAAEAAILTLCQERHLFRLLAQQPHGDGGAAPTPDALSALLAAARVRGRGDPPAVPAPAAGSAATSNLPLPLTSFIGRAHDLAEVSALLTRTRLLTLTGTGGVGKTCLALEAGRTLLPQFPDGVWLVELAPLTDPVLVPQAVAAALGVREAAGRPLVAALVAALAAKRLLLVLDNCEHLVAACAEMTERLLQSCVGLRILATSREVLDIAGETVLRVPSLAVPDPRSSLSLDRLAQYEAVQLFVERVRARRPHFGLTDANAPAVLQVCRRLDGIPLALELAAARVPVLSIEQVAARLEDRFRLLTGGSRTAPPRQQTLRAMLDWSYALLPEPERVLLRRLSVFTGGWTLEAAEAIYEGEGITAEAVLDLLAQLVDKSLVIAEEQDGQGRYRLLETVRQYAAEKLAAGEGESAALRGRHLAYYVALAEGAEAALRGPMQAAAFAGLETEHDNLRAALGWAVASGTGEAGLRVIGAVWRFWLVRGHVGEGRAWLGRILACVEPSAIPPAVRAKALNGTGRLVAEQGDYTAARALLEEGLALYRELGDRHGVANGLNNLGTVAWMRGDYAAAHTLYGESRNLARELGDRWGVALALNSLGIVAWAQGDYVSARTFYDESLILKRQLDDQRGVADGLLNLGEVARAQGDYAAARALLEEGLALYRGLGDRRGVADGLNNLGTVALAQGDYVSAQALFDESLTLAWELGDQRGVAMVLEGVAAVAAQTGQPVPAARLYGAAERLREAIGAPLPPGDRGTYDRGVAAARAGLNEVAFASVWAAGRAVSLEQALDVARGVGDGRVQVL